MDIVAASIAIDWLLAYQMAGGNFHKIHKLHLFNFVFLFLSNPI